MTMNLIDRIVPRSLRRGVFYGGACIFVAAGALLGACDNGSGYNNDKPPAPTGKGSGGSNSGTTTGAPGSVPASGTAAPTTTPANTPSNPAGIPTTNPSGGAGNPPGGPGSNAANATPTPEVRILSILHAKNMEEVDAGKLAQQNGGSDGVKSYGDMLVRDHTDADDKVNQTAKDAGVTLLSADEVKQMLAREKSSGGAPGTPPPKPADPLAELRNLKGAEFDRAFMDKMHAGHTELIQIVEASRSTLKDQRVTDLIDKLMPVLREHQQKAGETLPGHR
jgi:putative membrane protein